jgi:hypothetical protein
MACARVGTAAVWHHNLVTMQAVAVDATGRFWGFIHLVAQVRSRTGAKSACSKFYSLAEHSFGTDPEVCFTQAKHQRSFDEPN